MKVTHAFTFVPLFTSAVAVAGERVDPDGAAASEALRGTVLVWHDAALYTEPKDGAPAVHFASLDGARKDRAGHVVPLHVVSTKDAFVEVELAGDRDCTWSQLQVNDDIAKLKLWVKRADLAPVLAKPYATAFDDGTSIALKPGVALVPTSDAGWYALGLASGDDVIVELPAASIAHAYTAEKVKPSAAIADDRTYQLAPDARVTLGDRAIALSARRATAIERHGKTTLVSYESRCASLRVSTGARSVHAIDDDDASIGGGSGLGVLDLRNEDYIPQSTGLATPSGKVIAYAGKPIYLAARPTGKTACIERRLRVDTTGAEPREPTDGDNQLRLCVPSTRVLHEKLRSAMSAHGSLSR
jgi:hypothetical protein